MYNACYIFIDSYSTVCTNKIKTGNDIIFMVCNYIEIELEIKNISQLYVSL